MNTQTTAPRKTLTDWQRWKICLTVLDITVNEWAEMAGVHYSGVSRYYKRKPKRKVLIDELDDLLERSWALTQHKLKKVV